MKKNKLHALSTAALMSGMISTLLVHEQVNAERLTPAAVKPVSIGGIEYRAPRKHMGFVEAWDTKDNHMIWRRQIYVVKHNPMFEGDVQEVYISKMTQLNDGLTIKNERGSVYRLNPASLEVRVIKGSLIEEKGEHADAKQADPAPEMIIRLANQKRVGTYKLNPKGLAILEKLITRNPNELAPGGLNLAPHGRILIQQHEYLLEPDELILTGRNETKIWNHKGIMELLIQHAVKQP